jgi:hypothetical protein
MNSQSEIFFVPLQLVITTDTLCCNVFLSQLLIRNNFSLYELTYKCVFPWRTKFQVQVSVAYKRNSPISPVSGLKTLDIQVLHRFAIVRHLMMCSQMIQFEQSFVLMKTHSGHQDLTSKISLYRSSRSENCIKVKRVKFKRLSILIINLQLIFHQVHFASAQKKFTADFPSEDFFCTISLI